MVSRYIQIQFVIATIFALLIGGCEDSQQLENCRNNAAIDKKERATEIANLKQQALDRANRVAQRYKDAIQKTTETSRFRTAHQDMPQGTIKCSIGPETMRHEAEDYVNLFPAEVESLRKEQIIYQAMGWMFEESEAFKKLKVDPNTEIVLPPAPPASTSEPKAEKTSGSQVLTATF